MNRILVALLFVAGATPNFAAPAPAAAQANGRTIKNLANFPLGQLQASLSPKLYKSLMISPLTAWVVVQKPPFGGEPKIVHSEAGGAYDALALGMAKGWGSVGYNVTESRTHAPSLMIHLLIYKIADGIMAVNFSHNDESFFAGRQLTDVWVGVCKDGKWAQIGGTKVRRESPEPYR